MKSELDKLPPLTFRRKAYAGDDISLIIFCDSSKEIYGFCCYGKSNMDKEYNLIFAKAKSAPIKAKTLPKQELMAAFLAIKCLPSILLGIKLRVTNVRICIDAQIVLSWILTCNVKSKNQFAKNRVSDICSMRSALKTNHDLECQFAYVSSEENPSDLLTRGLHCHSFVDRMDFWL